MTPKVSVLVTTFRPGGLDITFAGLRDQTFKDFEVVLVDHRFERRQFEMDRVAMGYGLNVLHVPEHRRNGKWLCMSAGWNTGMALARGEILIFLMDWTYTPPGWIESHLAHHEDGERRYTVAPYRYLTMPPLELLQPFDFKDQRDRGTRCTEEDAIQRGGVLDEMAAFKAGPFDPSWLPGLSETPPPDQDTREGHTPVPDTWIHLKNESVRRDVALDLNGLDERLDRGKGPIDTDWGLRLKASGTSLVWNEEGMAQCIDPRSYIRTMPWGDMHDRLEGRWSYDDGLIYNQLRRVEIASGGSPRAKNPGDIRTLAEGLEKWRTGAVEIYDFTDAAYWGGEVWPPSP